MASQWAGGGGGLILLPDPFGTVTSLLHATATVQRREPGSALVGGAGVICRLAQAHRATTDADAVIEATGRDSAEIVRLLTTLDSISGAGKHDAVEIDGVVVELIAAERVTAGALAAVDDEQDRLFVGAHR